jgi:hypothetical protein
MRTTAMLALVFAILLTGCTARNWYDGFQMQQRNQCSRYIQQYEVQRCLERVNGLTYDQYKYQQEELKAKK